MTPADAVTRWDAVPPADAGRARAVAATVLALVTLLVLAAAAYVAHWMGEWGRGDASPVPSWTWFLLAVPFLVVSWVVGLGLAGPMAHRDPRSPGLAGTTAALAGLGIGLLVSPVGLVLTDLVG